MGLVVVVLNLDGRAHLQTFFDVEWFHVKDLGSLVWAAGRQVFKRKQARMARKMVISSIQVIEAI